jgi:hypothetical protein
MSETLTAPPPVALPGDNVRSVPLPETLPATAPLAEAAATAPVTPAAAPLSWDDAVNGKAPVASSKAPPPPMSWDQGTSLKPLAANDKSMEGKRTGYIANIGARASEAGTALLGAPVDLATGLVNLPIRATNYVAGTNVPTIENPAGGQHWWNQLFGYLGANPEDVVPADKGEEMAGAAARGVASVLLPGSVAKIALAATLPGRAASPVLETLAAGTKPGAIAAGATGAMTGQQFADWVPDEWKSVADTVGNVVGAGPVLGAEAALRSGGRGVGNAVRAVRPGKAEAVIDPATNQPFYKAGTVNEQTGVGEPIMVTPGAQRMAAGRVAGAMEQTPAEAATTIEAAQGQQPAVPGYRPTVGQVTGDTGALSLERQLQSQPRGRVALADQAAENQRAFAAAVQGDVPTEQVQQAAGNYFRSVQTAQRAQIEAEARGLGTAARRDLEATGAHQDFAGDATQGMGAASRGALEDIRKPIKDQFGAAYDALEKGDPNLALDTSPIWEAQRTVREELGKAGELTASEQKVMDAAKDFRGVNKFTDLRSFQKAVSEKLREVGRNPQYGTESPAYRRLSILMDAVDRSMTEAADRHVAADPANAASIADRLAKGSPNADATAGTSADRSGEISGTVPGAQAGGGTGVSGTAVASGEQAGERRPSASNRSMAAVPANRADGGAAASGVGPAYYEGGRKPASINRRIAELGGVKPNADMLGYDLDKVHFGRQGRAVNPNGLEPDKIREILAQPHEGYLRPGETIDDLVQKMHQDRTPGQEVYPEHWQAQVRAQEALDEEGRRTATARGEAHDEIEGARLDRGLRLSNEEHQHAVDLRMQGVHEDEAIDQAIAASDAKNLGRAAQREAMGPPGVGPEATQADMHMAGASKLVENIKPEDVQTIRELNRGYREYKTDWRTGAIGKVLQRVSGGFKAGDSEVPGNLFPKGPKGAEAADQLIKNAGSVENAQRIIGDYPAKVFRDMALRDGVVTEAGFNAFQKTYGPVLAKFPELQAKFADARAAQATVERAAADHAARLRAYENSAAKAYLGNAAEGATPLKAITSIMGSKNAPAQFRELMQRAAPDQAAVEGIRQNFLDWMATKAGSSTEQDGGRPTTFINSTFKNMLKNADVRNAAKAVLTPDQYSMLFKVADAMDQVGSSANAIRIPGSPGSAADAHALSEALGGKGFWTNFGKIVVGEEAGHLVGSMLLHGSGLGLIGTAARFLGGGVGYLTNQMRALGIRNAEDLALEMMANPNFGKVMLRTAPTSTDSPIWRDMARKMMATGIGLGAGDRQQ